ncbi:MAG: hypothetical protein AABZ53_04625 [Planctomycetota bacterium]
MSQSPKVPKICIRCGQDCAGKPRTKDATGRYTCDDCAKTLMAQPDAPSPADPSIIPLEHEPHAPSLASMIDDSTLPRSCANCGIILGKSAVICSSCGFNTTTGKVTGATPSPSGGRKCLKCGYALEGLTSARCPECGTMNTAAQRVATSKEKAYRESVRLEYTKPVWMFVIGLVLSVALAALSTKGNVTASTAMLVYLFKYALYVPSGVIVFLLCCAIWIGFNAPIHLTALRLAGIYAITDAVASVVGFIIPMQLIVWLAMLLTYVGLLQDMLELDLVDAILVAVVTFFVRLGVVVAIVALNVT